MVHNHHIHYNSTNLSEKRHTDTRVYLCVYTELAHDQMNQSDLRKGQCEALSSIIVCAVTGRPRLLVLKGFPIHLSTAANVVHNAATEMSKHAFAFINYAIFSCIV